MIETTTPVNMRRSISPQIVLASFMILVAASLAMFFAEHVQAYFKYHNSPYAREAEQVASALELTLKEIEDNTSRDATFALNKIVTLDLDMAGYRTVRKPVRQYLNGKYVVAAQNIESEDPDYAKWDNEIMGRLSALVDQPTPIWFPSGDADFGRYDVIGRPKSLLQHEVAVATKKKDAIRAYRALEVYRWLLDSTDWGSAIRNSTIYQRRDIYSLVCTSMAADMWDEKQLNDLRAKLLDPINYLKIARQHDLESYASALESSSFFQDLDHAPQNLPTIYNHLEWIAKSGERSLENNGSYFENEAMRRLAIIAIGAKLYQLNKKDWPREFADLTEFGVPESFTSGKFSGQLFLPKTPEDGLSIRIKADYSYREVEERVVVR